MNVVNGLSGLLRQGLLLVSIGLVCMGLTTKNVAAYQITNTISPTIVASPIQIVLWVLPGVTLDNEVRVAEQIMQGADLWRDVPTSCISFSLNRIVRSPTEPTRLPSELMIIVGNGSDINNGGASHPSNGNPGTWFGAVADSPSMNMIDVAAHEIGHAIGFEHTTIGGPLYGAADYPIMHWAARVTNITHTLTQDDIAAVSVAYPCAATPLNGSTGTVQGRIVAGPTPLRGVNVIAVNTATNRPVVSILTGSFGTAAGEFSLRGLPPGNYRLDYRDGHSYLGVRRPLENTSSGVDGRGGFQVDNFAPFSSSSFTIAAGQTLALGDVALSLWDMAISSPELGNWLPEAYLNGTYARSLVLRGGVRDITATFSGLPPGISATMAGNASGVSTADRVQGVHQIVLSGVPTQAGIFTVQMTLTDRAGTVKALQYQLLVNLSAGGTPHVNYLFSAGGISGALGGRAGADAMCQAAAKPGLIPAGIPVRAFLSVNASDEIRDFPTTYGVRTDLPVWGPSGIVVADNWLDLVDGTIDTTLMSSQVMGSSELVWYSGSNADGSLATNHCANWTSGSGGTMGRVGQKGSTASDWISAGAGPCGSNQYNVLCLAAWPREPISAATTYVFPVMPQAGALGGRAGADALCRATLRPPFIPRNYNVRALLSVNANDEIRDFPTNYGARADAPIRGAVNLLTNNWTDLLDGSVTRSLINAGVYVSASGWISGSNTDGSLSAGHCTNWTDGSNTPQATHGDGLKVDGRWISQGLATCGSPSMSVVCAAY